MQITIQSSNLDNASDWRQRAETMARFTLRRLRHEIRRAHISLRDINGPRGGVDKECRITLTRVGSGHLVVTAQGRDVVNTLHDALLRLSQRLLRRQKREQRSARHVPDLSMHLLPAT